MTGRLAIDDMGNRRSASLTSKVASDRRPSQDRSARRDYARQDCPWSQQGIHPLTSGFVEGRDVLIISPYSEGGVERLPSGTLRQVRTGLQPQDREGASPNDPADAACVCRPGDRIARSRLPNLGRPLTGGFYFVAERSDIRHKDISTRPRDGLPRRINAMHQQGAELRKEAKGLLEQRPITVTLPSLFAAVPWRTAPWSITRIGRLGNR
jgi:hypothetical protein